MKKFKTATLFMLMLGLVCLGCRAAEPNAGKAPVIRNLQLTEYGFETYKQGTVTIYGEGFAEGDRLRLGGKAGGTHTADLFNIRTDGADFAFPKQIRSGTYSLALLRADQQEILGDARISILSPFREIPETAGVHIQGYVRCGDEPLRDVVVTDGYNVVCTDAKGVYRLPGHANAQFVIITLPAGYEASTVNNIPGYFRRLARGIEVQRLDFTLHKVDNDRHVVLTPADMHLSNRFKGMDIVYFKNSFIPDANDLIDRYRAKGFRPYILALGDMTSDRHWYMDLYNLSDYVKEMRPMHAPVFNCMGNHDNDIRFRTDWEGEQAYKEIVGPTYYSFNLGKIHYVVLDNTLWMNPPEHPSKSANGLTETQIEWLKKDLRYVDRNTPVYIAMHCQIAALKISGMHLAPTPQTEKWEQLFAALSEYARVHIFSGHTHVAYHVDYADAGYPNIFEHNTPGASGLWWWPTHYDGAEICNDGSPAGYGVIEAEGTDVWRYHKGYGFPAGKPFRTYDRNQIHITAEKYLPATMSPALKSKFNVTAGEYFQADHSNEVLINCWDFGPGWTISVRENGRELPVTRKFVVDPLKILVYCAPALIKEGKYPNNGAARGGSWHIFTTNAASPASTLEITIRDDEGRTYTEQMQRPKSFHKRAYN